MQLVRNGLLLLILLVYLCFLTQSYFWDGVLFSYNIEQVRAGALNFAVLLQPNHLFYSVFGYLVYAAFAGLGLQARAITLLQICNSLASVAVGWLLFRWVQEQTKNLKPAIFGLLLFAFGATWWKYSTDADAYIIAGGLVLLAVLFALKQRPALVAAAACHVAGMLLHELAVFAYAPVLMTIWLTQKPLKTRLRSMGLYVAITALAVAAIYYICYQNVAAQYASFTHWITSYASDTTITRGPLQLLTEYPISCGKLFAGGKLGAIRDQFSPWTLLGLIVCALGLGTCLLAARKPSPLPIPRLDARTRIVLWAWIVPLAVFLAWFDPGNAAHKLFLWAPIVMLIATAAWTQRRAVAIIALTVALTGWNFAAYVYPRSRVAGDPLVAFAYRLANELPRNATVYYAAFSPDDWYLAYFAPKTKWRPLPVTTDSSPSCYESTALSALHPPLAALGKTWALTTKGRNVRVGCMATP